jgi:small neutral amino acid transporter SnatA (MarC family)
MKITTESLAIDGATGVRWRGSQAVALVVFLAFAGCTPPTEVVDLHNAPQATIDAMQRVNVVPLGTPGPAGAGSIATVSGYGCAQTAEAAGLAAIQQIRVKAMALHATAVVDVLVEPEGAGVCFGGYNMIARGIAVAPRGIPSSY